MEIEVPYLARESDAVQLIAVVGDGFPVLALEEAVGCLAFVDPSTSTCIHLPIPGYIYGRGSRDQSAAQ